MYFGLELTKNLSTHVSNERNATYEVLNHLREFEKRRLYSSFQCSSLYQYCVEKLNYSSDQAQRRIASMRLLREVPELEPKIKEGKLTIATLSQARTFFNQESKKGNTITRLEKLEVLEKLETKSKRDCEIILKSECWIQKEIEIPQNKSVVFNLTPELEEKLSQLKGLLSHKKGWLSDEELLLELANMALEKLNPAREPKRKRINSAFHCPGKVDGKISEPTRRLIWQRDKGQCTNCKSKYAVEIDHIRPRSFVGTNDPENLRLLCRSCNQRAAIQKLGQTTMNRYF